MEKKKRTKFQPGVCSCCGQTMNYDLSLDRGSALIVLALYNAVQREGRNLIHVGNEMVRPAKDFPSYRDMVAGGWMTFKMEGNLSRQRRHGLIAQGEEQGTWLITQKGAKFLRGERIPRVAIISKVTGHKSHYQDEYEDTVTFSDLMRKETPFWDLSSRTLIELAGESEVEPARLF